MQGINVRLSEELGCATLTILTTQVTSKDTKSYVPLSQLWKLVAKPLGVTKHTYYKVLGNIPSNKRLYVTSELMGPLKDAQVIPNRAPKCEVLSFTTTCHMLRACQVPLQVIASMVKKEIVTNPPQTMETNIDTPSVDDVACQEFGQLHEEVSFKHVSGVTGVWRMFCLVLFDFVSSCWITKQYPTITMH